MYTREYLKNILEKSKKVPKSLIKSEDLKSFLYDHFSKNIEEEIVRKVDIQILLYSYIYEVDFICKNNRIKTLISFKSGIRKFCNSDPNICKCLKDDLNSKKEEIVKKRKRTLNEKYHTDKILSIPDFLEKKKNTSIKKYGVEHPMKSNQVKEKLKETTFLKYGVDNVRKSDIVKEKIKQTNLKKFGYENILLLPEIKEKTKQIIKEKKELGILQKHKQTKDLNLKKFGLTFVPQKHHDVEKLKELNDKNIFINKVNELKNYKYLAEYFGVDRETIKNYAKKYNLVDKIELLYNTSYEEKEIAEYIKSIYEGKVIENCKNIINPYELDIFIPEKNLAIEYCGLYWHSEFSGNKSKYYHFNKWKECKEKNIQLLTIFSDEWLRKKDIIKKIIKNNISNEKPIYARKTKIIEDLNLDTIKDFYNQNHIQGYTYSKYNYGLIYEDNLIALISFNKKRICSGDKKIKDGEFELTRYCPIKRIVGGLEKFLNHFIKIHNPKIIYTYTDNRLFNGSSLERNNFIRENKIDIDYWFIDPSYEKRIYRYGLRKQILLEKYSEFLYNIKEKSEIQILKELGYDRIWGCGKTKWIRKIQ